MATITVRRTRSQQSDACVSQGNPVVRIPVVTMWAIPFVSFRLLEAILISFSIYRPLPNQRIAIFARSDWLPYLGLSF